VVDTSGFELGVVAGSKVVMTVESVSIVTAASLAGDDVVSAVEALPAVGVLPAAGGETSAACESW
jgi:hypothetical protein